MFRPPRSVFLGLSLLVLSATFGAGPGRAQHALSLSRWAAATDEPCGNVWLGESETAAARMGFQPKPYDRRLSNVEPLCASVNFLAGLANGGGAPPQFPDNVTSSFAEDPVETELAATADGMVIAGARQQVLGILREGNSCSAWFAEAEPNPAAKFATMHFRSDAAGSAVSLGDFDGGRFSITEPYVARAQENVGSGSIITLNAHGAFFQQRAGTMFRLPSSAPHSRPTICVLHVGTYQGGSLKAQVATLLHEYAHIIGLIPVDTGRREGPQLSTQNTETVLRHCRKQIEASPNRTILLPAAFAHF